MTQEEVAEHLQRTVNFTSKELDAFFSITELKDYKKNQIITQEQKDNADFIFIKTGCLMTYITSESGIQVIQFGLPMWWTGDLYAITEGKKSVYSIKSMVDSEVYLIKKDEFEDLFDKYPRFNEYFRIIYQNALVHHQKRIIRNISFSAEQKYRAFLDKYPGLESIVPQKYIASFMGITPEFLSKMKKNL